MSKQRINTECYVNINVLFYDLNKSTEISEQGFWHHFNKFGPCICYLLLHNKLSPNPGA